MAAALPAFVALGQLVGFLDEDGAVQWTWLGSPAHNSLIGLLANRDRIGDLIEQLTDQPHPDVPLPFDATHNWTPVAQPTGSIEIGVVWTKEGNPKKGDLQIGLGTKGAAPVDFTLLAQLLQVAEASQQVASQLGGVSFTVKAPKPSFLQDVSLAGTLAPPSAPAPPVVALMVQSDATTQRVLSTTSPTLSWDCIRLATFVLHAWAHTTSLQSGSSAFVQRLDKHGFPLLGQPSVAGEPAPTIGALPMVAGMGTPAQFNTWSKSLVSTGPTSKETAGALTFLWHARALLTGNESPQFVPGSIYFPLGGGAVTGTPPNAGSLPTTSTNLEPTTAGLHVGIQANTFAGAANQIVLLGVDDNQKVVLRIVLARMDANGQLLGPAPLAQPPSKNPRAFLWDLRTWTIGGGAATIAVTVDNNGKHVVTLSGAGIPPNALQLTVAANNTISYHLGAAGLQVDLPPQPLPASGSPPLLATLIQWVLAGLPTTTSDALTSVRNALATLVAAQLTNANDAAAKAAALGLAVAVANLSTTGAEVTVGPLEVGLGLANGVVKPKLTIGPNEVDELDDAIHIGRAEIEVTFRLPGGNATNALDVTLTDVRLGRKPGSLPTGLATSLIPDLKKLRGFQIVVHWDKAGGVKLSCDAKIPLQVTLGPLEISSLIVELRSTTSLSIAIDLSFALSVIKVSAIELGVRFPLAVSNPPQPAEVFLHGLGVSLDMSAVTLKGMFAEAPGPPPADPKDTKDYVGGAVVNVAGLFELSAIGGYAKHAGEASLFVFASLRAPLGGPPFCFVTGIAGGFGYNRSLPPNAGPTELEEHPFFKLMNGDLDVSAGASAALAKLSTDFHPAADQHWVAGGIEFTSFGFINGKIVVVVGLGHEFSIAVMGLASFGIEHIAYFQLAIEALIDSETVLVQAAISPNSYVIDPSFFSLRGGFALGVWHGGTNAGDFVLTIGGYHPQFRAPDHYPKVDRVGVTVATGSYTISLECFFACTPRALMAGASLSVSAHLGPISAGLDVYVQVLIEWDPFFISAEIGVCVWFVFFGRHEISVTLELHTPPFGGLATVHVFVASFKIRFGSDFHHPPPLALDELFTRQIGVPATAGPLVAIAAFNTASTAGLFKIDVTSGRAAAPTAQPPQKSSAQEGLGNAPPIVVEPEFALTLLTRLPIEPHFPLAPEDRTAVATFTGTELKLTGAVHVPLARSEDLTSTLAISGLMPDDVAPQAEWLADRFPAALFGRALPTGLAALLPPGPDDGPVVHLIDGVALDYSWQEPDDMPVPITPLTPRFEESDNEQDYPLPLGFVPAAFEGRRHTEPGLIFMQGSEDMRIGPPAPVQSRRQQSMQAILQHVAPPVGMRSRRAHSARVTSAARMREMTIGDESAARSAITAPLSPQRRPELFSVNLRVLPVTTAVADRGERLHRLRRARNVIVEDHAPRERAGASASGKVTVEAGEVAQLDVTAHRLSRAQLTAAGEQTVRMILLGQSGDLVGDAYLAGDSQVAVPGRARRVVVIGEGFSTVLGNPRAGTRSAEPVGIEHDTVLLALTRRMFAAHGCVVESHTALPFTAEPLDSLPGATLLRAATRCTLHFPFAVEQSSLVLTVAPTVASPGIAVDGVRWRSNTAALTELSAFAGPEETTLVMSVDAPPSWSLELDFSPNWRLTGAHVAGVDAATLARRLDAGGACGRVDDRFVQAPEKTSTTVTLEVVS